jgi:hypothetical protein
MNNLLLNVTALVEGTETTRRTTSCSLRGIFICIFVNYFSLPSPIIAIFFSFFLNGRFGGEEEGQGERLFGMLTFKNNKNCSDIFYFFLILGHNYFLYFHYFLSPFFLCNWMGAY